MRRIIPDLFNVILTESSEFRWLGYPNFKNLLTFSPIYYKNEVTERSKT
jgi:hypothetical protein